MTRYSPWTEIRNVKIHQLHESFALECLRNGGDHSFYVNLKEIAREILGHPSKRTMLDYFEDMEDSRWISMEGNIVRLLKIPIGLEARFKELEEKRKK